MTPTSATNKQEAPCGRHTVLEGELGIIVMHRRNSECGGDRSLYRNQLCTLSFRTQQSDGIQFHGHVLSAQLIAYANYVVRFQITAQEIQSGRCIFGITSMGGDDGSCQTKP